MMIAPDQFFDRAVRRLSKRNAGMLAVFGLGLSFWVLATLAITLRHGWIGAGLLGLAYLGLGFLEALLRQEGRPGRPPIGLLIPAFGFAILDPTRALAAMFLMFGLAVWAMVGYPRQGWAILLVTSAYIAAAILPSYFSILAYLVGIMAFVLAEEGAVRR